jgi:DNA-directed RNA polymerase subunit omega
MSNQALDGITNPPIDALLDKAGSKYSLVLYAAKRARQINAYYSQLGEGLLAVSYTHLTLPTID